MKKFKKGDEIYTEKKYRSLSKYKTYIVIDYFKTPGFSENYEHYSVQIVNNLDTICSYSPNNFIKTKRQLRKEKILALCQNN